jgi:uncharacterized protein (TIGR03086 family)
VGVTTHEDSTDHEDAAPGRHAGRSAIELLPGAVRAFGERVHAIGPDGWSRETPCEQWRVRDLVNHLTAEHLWAPELLAGRTIAEVGTRFDGDVLGGQPEKAWDEAAEASVRAWRACSPETVVHLSFGDVPAGEYAEQMLLDLVVHGWDLGAAIVRPDRPRLAAMDLAQVVHVLAYVRGHRDELVSSGMFGSPGPDDDGTGPATLLRLVGRDPDWRPRGSVRRPPSSAPDDAPDLH